MESRSLRLLFESCKSEHTRKQYRFYLDKFMAFNSLDNYDELARKDPTQLQIMVEDWVMALKKQVGANTVPIMVYGVKAFFEANDIDLKWKKIIRLFPERTKQSGKAAYTKDQIQTLIKVSKDLRETALILFLASSGVRIGAIPGMNLKHLTDYAGCKMLTVYAGTNEEYITFITPEAAEALHKYHNKRQEHGEYFTPDTPLFRTSYRLKSEKVKPCLRPTLQEIIRRVLVRAGLRSGHANTRHAIQIDHGFRKFFNEMIKTTEGMNPHYAEKLMGHSVTIPLDNNYLEAKPDKLFKEYQKAITNLTIDDKEKLKQEAEQAKAQLSEIEQVKQQMADMQSELAIQKMINRMNEYYIKSGQKPRVESDKVHYEPPTEGWDFNNLDKD